MNKSESKYFNTAVRMDEAFLSLIEKKGFEYITVKEICAAAGVHRSTFYLHYETVADLLDETVKYMHGKFLSYFDIESGAFIQKLHDCPENELMLITPQYLLPYLTYVKENRRLYGAVMKRPSAFLAEGSYNAMFRYVFDPILARFSVPEEKREYIMAFYLNGISAIVARWIKGGCKESEDFVSGLIIDCIPRK